MQISLNASCDKKELFSPQIERPCLFKALKEKIKSFVYFIFNWLIHLFCPKNKKPDIEQKSITICESTSSAPKKITRVIQKKHSLLPQTYQPIQQPLFTSEKKILEKKKPLEAKKQVATAPQKESSALSLIEEKKTEQTAAKIPFPAFKDMDSSKLQKIPLDAKISKREDFFAANWNPPPPLIGKSDFVSKKMTEHLMRNKKDSALAEKYVIGDHITNMEGALHTIVVPVCSALMTADVKGEGPAEQKSFGNNEARPVILSASIHLDFEFKNVVMALTKVEKESIEGLSEEAEIPSQDDKRDSDLLQKYEEKLRKFMVYHLTEDHRLPSHSEITPDCIFSEQQARDLIEDMIRNPEEINLRNKFLKIGHYGETLISLEILFQLTLHQLRNECKIINPNAPQGYVYTIDPPSIFARALGGPLILNRLQALAFKALSPDNLFTNLKMIAFSDYQDKNMIGLLQEALPDMKLVSTDELFPNGSYQGPEGLALVLHNSSDAFGQNIETEGLGSMDGIVGTFSDAACVLKRTRSDLVDHIF